MYPIMFQHPKNVCMTYTEHLCLSLYFSFIMWIGSMQAFVHAFVPDIFITSTTDLAHDIQTIIKRSGCSGSSKS
jgi:hypothetical protein